MSVFVGSGESQGLALLCQRALGTRAGALSPWGTPGLCPLSFGTQNSDGLPAAGEWMETSHFQPRLCFAAPTPSQSRDAEGQTLTGGGSGGSLPFFTFNPLSLTPSSTSSGLDHSSPPGSFPPGSFLPSWIVPSLLGCALP